MSTESLDTKSSVSHADLIDLKLQLSIMLHVNGVRHVKAKRLADEIGKSPSQTGSLLRAASREGWVKQWNNHSPITWKIVVDEGGER
jgi:ribosomal protein S25